MSAFLSLLLSNSTILAVFGGLVAALGAYMRGRVSGGRREREKQKAKDADAYEQHLKDIAAASDARNRVPVGMPEHDPNRRD